jgi:hypothetical protein
MPDLLVFARAIASDPPVPTSIPTAARHGLAHPSPKEAQPAAPLPPSAAERVATVAIHHQAVMAPVGRQWTKDLIDCRA